MTWDGRGRGNNGMLLKPRTAFIDGMRKTVEVGEAMSGGEDSDDGTCD